MSKSYGFGNVSELTALNKACTYMIASNLAGSASKTDLEEELVSLNKLDIILESNGSKIDFINAYFSGRGDLLKTELNNAGVSDDLLNRINFFNQSKLNGTDMQGYYGANIDNDIDKVFANLVNSKKATEEQVAKFESQLMSDQIFDYSKVGVSKSSENMNNFINYMKNQPVENVNTMQKVA